LLTILLAYAKSNQNTLTCFHNSFKELWIFSL